MKMERPYPYIESVKYYDDYLCIINIMYERKDYLKRPREKSTLRHPLALSRSFLSLFLCKIQYYTV